MDTANLNNKSSASALSPKTFVTAFLKGSGQVMFQGSVWTGLLFLVGIFWGAFQEGQHLVAFGAVAGLLVATIVGYILPLPKEDGEQGLWGFNGILVGCAFFTFMGNTPYTWVALVLCAAMTVWVRTAFNNAMGSWKVNSLTFPFVFSTWIFLLATKLLKGIPGEYLSTPELTAAVSTTLNTDIVSLITYWLKGVSQVFLINSWITGVIFLVALFVSNKWAAIWGAIGSAVALAFAIAFGAPASDISSGLFGFSPTLTGIALGMTFYSVNWKSAIWALLGIIVTVFIQAGMDALVMPFGIPTLTAPFCIATWFFLLPLFKFNVEHKEAKADHSHWHNKTVKP